VARETLANEVQRTPPENEMRPPVTVELSGEPVRIWLRAADAGQRVE
jgi:hypothetical protein